MECCPMCSQKRVHRPVVIGLHSDVPDCIFPRNLERGKTEFEKPVIEQKNAQWLLLQLAPL